MIEREELDGGYASSKIDISWEICTKTFSRKSTKICPVGDVHARGNQCGCGFCDKKFFQGTTRVIYKIMQEEEVSDEIGMLEGMETEENDTREIGTTKGILEE